MTIDCEDVGKYIDSNRPGTIIIFYGQDGTDRTKHLKEYAKGHSNSIMIRGSKERGHGLKQLEDSLSERNGKPYITYDALQIINDLKRFVESFEDSILILDDYDLINETVLDHVMSIHSIYWDKVRLVIAMDSESILDNEGLCEIIKRFDNKQYRLRSSEESIKKEFIEKLDLSEEHLNRCIELSKSNLSKARLLSMCISLAKSRGDGFEDGLVDFHGKKLKDILKSKSLNEEQREVLCKSSVIGKEFDKSILESNEGFEEEDAEGMLNEIEKGKQLIKREGDTNTYEFIEDSIHHSILSDIPRGNRITWNGILADYYTFMYKETQDSRKYRYLEKILEHALLSGNNVKANRTALCLLSHYSQIDDYFSQRSVIEEVLELNTLDSPASFYLRFKEARVCSKIGDHHMSFGILKELLDERNNYCSETSRLYLRFYLSEAMYGSGCAPEALSELRSLVDVLNKNLSVQGADRMSLLCSVYSNMASYLKNLDDDKDSEAVRYYGKAVSIAEGIRDQRPEIYYKLLQKCSMFYDPETDVASHLEKCCDYFKKTGDRIEYAKTSCNLATHLLFTGNTDEYVEDMFDKAVKIFESAGSRDISVPCNNLGILHAMNNEFDKACKDFEMSLRYEPEDFSTFTSFSNLFNVHMLFGDVERGKKYFEFMKSLYEKHRRIENSNFMYKLYFHINSFIMEEYENNNDDIKKKILEHMEEYCVTDFFSKYLEDFKNRTGQTSKVIEHPYRLLDEMNKRKTFFVELLFWE